MIEVRFYVKFIGDPDAINCVNNWITTLIECHEKTNDSEDKWNLKNFANDIESDVFYPPYQNDGLFGITLYNESASEWNSSILTIAIRKFLNSLTNMIPTHHIDEYSILLFYITKNSEYYGAITIESDFISEYIDAKKDNSVVCRSPKPIIILNEWITYCPLKCIREEIHKCYKHDNGIL